ncbi:MAG TPA: phenylacetate--CoA ligase family protein [Thermoplasmata archaeon]|nr:phenylacetate--CoA ligase family protein [Thermoplasmata archaeon]
MVEKEFWNKKMETMPLEEMRTLQFKKFREIFKYAYHNNQFYRRKFEKAGVKPDQIKSFKDISKIPVLTKEELREAYPFGLIIPPPDKWVELHSSSGTTGKPVVNVYTKKDIEVWKEDMARNLWAGGLRPGDRLQNAYGLGLFTGGFGFAYGAQKIGALMIPTSSGNTKRQIRLALDFGSTALAATPSYGLYLAEKASEMGYDTRKDFKFKVGFFGAEAWSEEMRERLEYVWGDGFQARESYGLTEVGGPGTSFDCQYKNGLHINADHFLVECVDKDMNPVAPGEKGELVITTLEREGFPAIRFRTKDISYLMEEKCECGRTLYRHARIMGRTDDMMKVKGVIVFPKQIEEAVLAVDGVSENYLIEKYKSGVMTSLRVKVEPTQARFEKGKLEALAKEIQEEIMNIVGLRLEVQIVEPGSLPRSEGKAKRVVDLTQ